LFEGANVDLRDETFENESLFAWFDQVFSDFLTPPTLLQTTTPASSSLGLVLNFGSINSLLMLCFLMALILRRSSPRSEQLTDQGFGFDVRCNHTPLFEVENLLIDNLTTFGN